MFQHQLDQPQPRAPRPKAGLLDRLFLTAGVGEAGVGSVLGDVKSHVGVVATAVQQGMSSAKGKMAGTAGAGARTEDKKSGTKSGGGGSKGEELEVHEF